jgi:hypothetical protein
VEGGAFRFLTKEGKGTLHILLLNRSMSALVRHDNQTPESEPSRPRVAASDTGGTPAAAGLAAAAPTPWFLAPVPPRRRPSSRWQGAGVHPLVD